MARGVVSIIACCISVLVAGPPQQAEAFQIVEASPLFEVDESMRIPTDAAFSPEGTLFILDGYQNRIVARSPDGVVRVLVPEGSCALNRPLGITVHQDRLLVANTGGGTVCELDLEGRCLRSVSFSGPEGADPNACAPTDLAIEGAVVAVADRGANRLHICLYPSFERVQEAGDFGEPGGSLNGPYLLEMKHGRILATDIMNGRLVQMTNQGRFVKHLAERGVREGQFVRPKGVATGAEGLVFISDSTLGVVQAFDAELEYRGTVGRAGRPLRFRHPAGIAAWGDLLAVVEQGRNKVSVLRLERP
ncbi:MAG: NHL repeat-containing protein [bacterium]